MKKYFVVETDEICEFGDALHLVFFKDIEGGKVTVEKEVEFNENTMDWMIEMGFVEEREVEEGNNDLIDFDNPCDALAALEEDFEILEEKVEKLERGLHSFTLYQEEVNRKMKAFADAVHPLSKEGRKTKGEKAQPKEK